MSSSSVDEQIQVVHIEDVPVVEVCPGITQRNFPSSDQLIGWVLDFEPGSEWPEVTLHATEERYFVLTGEIIDNDEHRPAGTYVVFAAGTSHRPRTESGARLLGVNIRPAVEAKT